MAKGGGKFSNAATEGFAGGLGAFGALALYVLLGMIVFIPGFVLMMKEHAKPKGSRNSAMLGVAYVLMLIGAAISLGLGFGIIIENLAGDL